jgi:hypothetical protein
MTAGMTSAVPEPEYRYNTQYLLLLVFYLVQMWKQPMLVVTDQQLPENADLSMIQ